MLATGAQAAYLAVLRRRAVACRVGLVPVSADDMIGVLGDERLASLDLRLAGQPMDGPGKIAAAAARIADGAAGRCSLQVVFCEPRFYCSQHAPLPAGTSRSRDIDFGLAGELEARDVPSRAVRIAPARELKRGGAERAEECRARGVRSSSLTRTAPGPWSPARASSRLLAIWTSPSTPTARARAPRHWHWHGKGRLPRGNSGTSPAGTPTRPRGAGGRLGPGAGRGGAGTPDRRSRGRRPARPQPARHPAACGWDNRRQRAEKKKHGPIRAVLRQPHDLRPCRGTGWRAGKVVAGLLPAGGRGARVRPGGRPAGQEPARPASCGQSWEVPAKPDGTRPKTARCAQHHGGCGRTVHVPQRDAGIAPESPDM